MSYFLFFFFNFIIYSYDDPKFIQAKFFKHAIRENKYIKIFLTR